MIATAHTGWSTHGYNCGRASSHIVSRNEVAASPYSPPSVSVFALSTWEAVSGTNMRLGEGGSPMKSMLIAAAAFGFFGLSFTTTATAVPYKPIPGYVQGEVHKAHYGHGVRHARRHVRRHYRRWH
jgi:hypothetical protein